MTNSDFQVKRFHSLKGLLLIFFLLIVTGSPAIVTAADSAGQTAPAIVKGCLEAFWTGRDSSPELEMRQKTLRSLIESGGIRKAELETVIEETLLPLMDRQKTSRYILNTLPERIEALLSPAVGWDDFKGILWRVASSPVEKDNPILIKIGTLAPPGTPWLIVPETKAIPEIERLTGGKVKLKIYGGGVMGEDADILRKMDVGQLDGCGCTAVGVLTASPDASALLMPALFNNYDEVDYILKKFRNRLDEGFEKKGYILGALIDTGFFYIFSKNKVTSLADIRKQKPYTWFGIVETTLFDELGINAIPVAVPEAVSALSTGLADTATGPAAWFLGMQAYQYVNYIIKPPLFYSPAAIVVSTQTKDRIKAQTKVSDVFAFNVQEILVSQFNSLEPEWRQQVRSYESKCLEAFETKCGMKVMTFSDEDMKVIKEASKAVQKKLAGKIFPEDLIDDIQKALAEYRASH